MSRPKKSKSLSKTVVKVKSDSPLTLREHDIIRMHMKGKNRKDIARAWNISISTVDTHIRHIHLKTNTNDVQGVIKYGYEHGLDK
jgi:DNA-binding CsgD family transcriptional regulator